MLLREKRELAVRNLWESGVNLECFSLGRAGGWSTFGGEQGKRLGPVSVVPQTRSPGFPRSFDVGMSAERPLSSRCPLVLPGSRGSMEEVLE